MTDTWQDPLDRFAELLKRVRATPEIKEPTAMTLATVGADGRPSARIVLLKGVDARGFVFYTNLDSRKGREVRARGDVALVMHYVPLEIQVRVEGHAAQVSDEEADRYFAGRPRGSQIGAWASDQSRPLPDRRVLEEKLAEVTARFEGKTVTRPPNWSGFLVTPRVIEFWKNRESRLHEREVYTRAAPSAPWTTQLLYP